MEDDGAFHCLRFKTFTIFKSRLWQKCQSFHVITAESMADESLRFD